MPEIVAKIIFFLFTLPFLMATEGVKKINNFLEKRGLSKIDWAHIWLFIFIILLIIMWANGFR
jgi:hypothetical protein